MAVTTKKAANAIKIRTMYDSEDRSYICNDYSIYYFNRRYKYIDEGLRRFHIAKGNVGLISDCYILYVIALWGIMDLNTLTLTLHNYYTKNIADGRMIPDFTEDGLISRLKVLIQNGLIFRSVYRISPIEEDEEDPENNGDTNILYCVPKDGLSLMNTALKKVVYPRGWIECTREHEAIGTACAAYAASLFSSYTNATDFLDGAVRTKEVGTTNISAELEFNIGGDRVRVGFLALYLYFDKRIQSEREYHLWVTAKINLIRNYFYTRKNYDPALVLVCEDNEDLDKFIKYFSKTQFMDDYLDRIYFASEGALRAAPSTPNKMLLQYLPSADVEGGYEFVNSPIKGIK